MGCSHEEFMLTGRSSLQVIGLVAILVCIFYYHTGPATNSSTTDARPPLPAALVD
jgi:hypothetical protein